MSEVSLFIGDYWLRGVETGRWQEETEINVLVYKCINNYTSIYVIDIPL